MATILIPIDGEVLSYFDQQVELDGVVYTLEFRWNVRAEAWFMSVLNEDFSTVYIAGARVALGFFTMSRVVDSGAPTGKFFAFDSTGDNVEPGYEDFGSRVQLLYIPWADIAAEL